MNDFRSRSFSFNSLLGTGRFRRLTDIARSLPSAGIVSVTFGAGGSTRRHPRAVRHQEATGLRVVPPVVHQRPREVVSIPNATARSKIHRSSLCAVIYLRTPMG
jgi:hypothetical protein